MCNEQITWSEAAEIFFTTIGVMLAMGAAVTLGCFLAWGFYKLIALLWDYGTDVFYDWRDRSKEVKWKDTTHIERLPDKKLTHDDYILPEVRKLLGTVEIHKHKFRLLSAHGDSYSFICHEAIGKNRCGEVVDINYADFWGNYDLYWETLVARNLRAYIRESDLAAAALRKNGR